MKILDWKQVIFDFITKSLTAVCMMIVIIYGGGCDGAGSVTGGCTPTWTDLTWSQGYANDHYMEFYVSTQTGTISAVQFRVGDTVHDLARGWKPDMWWVRTSPAIYPSGTMAVLHATRDDGAMAKTLDFQYLVETSPATDPCDSGCIPTWTDLTWSQGYANDHYMEFYVSTQTGTISAVQFRVGDTVHDLARGWKPDMWWVRTSPAIYPSGTMAVLHATRDDGAMAKTLDFQYLVETSPATDPCGGGCIPTTCQAQGAECGTIDDGCGGTLDCGLCQEGYQCNANHQCVSECIPTTCQAQGAECGTIDNGCGGTLYCGLCQEGYQCNANNQCISECTPTTCQAQGAECGTIDNGCGGTLDCGLCQEGYQCNANNQCISECTPTTCQAQGAECGTIDNGCGGTLDCGLCQEGYQCNANNQCISDCTPTTCQAQGAECGTIDNGCGGTLDCGLCQEGYQCNANNQCISDCTPDCAGRICGSDGCGGSCGTCSEGFCDAAGQCITADLIDANRSSGVAPLSVFFEATDGIFSGVDDFKDPVYEWHFGDPESGVYATNGKSKNQAFGKVAAHVFTRPGDYTVSLSVTHEGVTTQDSMVIHISDPDVVYAGSRTICISASNDFTGCPAGAQRIITSDFDLNDAGVLSYLGEGNRVLLRSGEVFYASRSSTMCGAGPRHLGAFGSGARPRVVSSVGSGSFWFLGCSNEDADDVRIVGIEIDGQNIGRRGPRMRTANNLLYYDVDVHDFTSQNINADVWLAQAAGRPVADGFTLADSHLHDAVGNHNLYVAARRLAVLGSTLDGCGSHALRVLFTERAVIAHNLIANAGRVRSGHALKMTNETGSMDGISVPTDEATRRFIISDNTFMGNGASDPNDDWLTSFGPQGTSRAYPETVRDGIIERNVFIAGTRTSALVNLGAADLLFRNNLMIGANSFFRAFLLRHYSCGSPAVADNQILNNTYYHPTDSTDFVRTERGYTNSGVVDPANCFVANNPDPISLRYPDNTTVRNNLVYGPDGNMVIFSAVDDQEAGTSHIIEANINAATHPFIAANPSTNPVDPAHYQLHSTSPALDSGMSLPWVDLDFNNQLRTDGQYDVGCMEN